MSEGYRDDLSQQPGWLMPVPPPHHVYLGRTVENGFPEVFDIAQTIVVAVNMVTPLIHTAGPAFVYSARENAVETPCREAGYARRRRHESLVCLIFQIRRTRRALKNWRYRQFALRLAVD